jgi:hypothetical protein
MQIAMALPTKNKLYYLVVAHNDFLRRIQFHLPDENHNSAC